MTWRCDCVGWDNSDPPQLWAWAGEYGDEASEPLFRLPADGLRAEWKNKDAEIERLRTNLDAATRMLKHLERANDALVQASNEKTTRIAELEVLLANNCPDADPRVAALSAEQVTNGQYLTTEQWIQRIREAEKEGGGE